MLSLEDTLWTDMVTYEDPDPLFANPIPSPEDLADWTLEWDAASTFPCVRMRLGNTNDPHEGGEPYYMLWYPERFPTISGSAGTCGHRASRGCGWISSPGLETRR